MADHVAVFRLDNKTTCCLFCGVKLYFFKTFPSARGLIKLFITPHNQYQIFYFFLLCSSKVNRTLPYTEEDEPLCIQGKGLTLMYIGERATPSVYRGRQQVTLN